MVFDPNNDEITQTSVIGATMISSIIFRIIKYYCIDTTFSHLQVRQSDVLVGISTNRRRPGFRRYLQTKRGSK